MYKVLKPFVFILFLAIINFQTACNNNDDVDPDSICDEFCTTEFVTISVTITGQSQNPVALDSYSVVNLETAQDITITLNEAEFEFAQQEGRYPLVNDATFERLQGSNIQFTGFINGQQVITGNYSAGRGCCHVEINSGDLQLTL